MTPVPKRLVTLRDARALVAQGWCQGHAKLLRDDKGYDYCATGAIVEAAEQFGCGSHGLASGLPMRQAVEIMEQVTGSELVNKWNDEDGRTQAEVLAAFDEAIRRAEL